MLRHRSSLERHFTPKASAICFPSVKGRFCSPSVLIYREVRVRTHAPATKKRSTGVDRLNNLWVGRQGFSLLRRRPLRRFRALRAALANAHAFTQLRAPTGLNPCRGNKKATNRSRSLSVLWWSIQRMFPNSPSRCHSCCRSIVRPPQSHVLRICRVYHCY